LVPSYIDSADTATIHDLADKRVTSHHWPDILGCVSNQVNEAQPPSDP